MGKRIVFAYARMNPPTMGHRFLRNAVVDRAEEDGCEHLIVLSRSHGDIKNPLDPQTKMFFIDKVVGDANYAFATLEKPTMIQWLVDLNAEGFDEIVMVCGSDRIKEYTNLLNRYNNVPIATDKNIDICLFNFSHFEVISSGERDGDNIISSTMIREAARDGDYRTFYEAYPTLSHYDAFHLFDLIRLHPAINKSKARVKSNVRPAGKEKKATRD